MRACRQRRRPPSGSPKFLGFVPCPTHSFAQPQPVKCLRGRKPPYNPADSAAGEARALLAVERCCCYCRSLSVSIHNEFDMLQA